MARLEAACDVERIEGPGALSHDELVRHVAGKQGLLAMITDQVDRAVVEAGRELRVIANAAVGYNNVDVAATRERGIIVTNTPDSRSNDAGTAIGVNGRPRANASIAARAMRTASSPSASVYIAGPIRAVRIKVRGPILRTVRLKRPPRIHGS